MAVIKRLSLVLATIIFSLRSYSQDYEAIEFSKDKDLKESDKINAFSRALEDKRIVFLGDIIHGEANIDSLRAVVIDYLIKEHGFNTVAFESGIFDLHVANKNLDSGLNVHSILSESIYDVWSGPSLQPLINVIDENREQIKLFGFDPKFSGNNYADIDLELHQSLNKAGVAPDSSLITEFADICEDLTLWNLAHLEPDHFLTTFNKVKNYFDQAVMRSGETAELLFWQQILSNIQGLYNYLKIDGIVTQTAESWKPEMANTRDSLMAANLKFYTQMFPKAKIVCWGAAAHFARSLNHLNDSTIQRFKPMGSYFGHEALSIGAMGYTGEYGWTGNLNTMPELPENSVEFKLSQVINNSALVNLASIENENPLYSSVFVEKKPIPGDWQTVFDWVIFCREIFPKTKILTLGKKNRKAKRAGVSGKPGIASLQDKRQVLLLSNKGVTLRGQVLNRSGQAIAFSSLAIKGSAYGVVSDEKGQFSIRIPDLTSDTLSISNVAYEVKDLCLKSINANDFLTIALDEKVVKLPEIIISDEKATALGILNEAIERIDENFYSGPFSNLVFQKSVLVDSVDKFPTSIQWLAENYIPDGYTGRDPDSGWKLMQARKGVYDEQSQKFLYENYKTTFHDFVGISLNDWMMYRENSFLNPKKHKYFTFNLKDVFTANNREMYIVSFTCNRINPKTSNYSVKDAKIFRGNIFINAEDFAITKIESEIVWSIDDISRGMYRRLDSKQSTLILRTSIEYENINGHYFPKYASRFENYNHFGFKEYFYFNHEPGEINDFHSNLEIENSDVLIDWAEVFETVYNRR